MQRLNGRLIILAISCVMCSCEVLGPDELSNVKLRTDKTEYRTQDKIAVIITNYSSWTLTYGMCVGRLEQKDGGEWLPADEVFPGSLGRVCPAIAFSLRAGRTDTLWRRLGNIGAGDKYRLEMDVDSPVGNRMLKTNSFRILP